MKTRVVPIKVEYNGVVYLLKRSSDGSLTFSKGNDDETCELVAKKKEGDKFWYITSYGFLVHDVKEEQRWELVRADDCPKKPAGSGICVSAKKGPIALMSVGFLAGELGGGPGGEPL